MGMNPDDENEFTKVFNIIEDIRKKSEGIDLQLPQICVIGLQSSGKSSLLAAISGIIFPQDAKMCTKCPIIVNLRKGKTNKVFINDIAIESSENMLEDLKDKMLELNDQNKHIVEKPINIVIEGIDITPLTLVDLPGIVHSTKELETRTKALVNKFIKSKNTLILIVREASQDKQTQAALDLAKDCDKLGERTIEIMTKADSVNNNKALIQIMHSLNDSKFDPKGPHIVCCRDADGEIRSFDNEMDVFKHDRWVELDTSESNVGVQNLREKRLPKQLSDNIKINLPDLKIQIKKKIDEAKNVLEDIGQEELDSTLILSNILEELKSSHRDVRIKISPYLIQFIDTIKAMKSAITQDDIDKYFEDDCWDPIIFQGQSAFKKSIGGITAGFKGLLKDLANEINIIAVASVTENEMLKNCKHDALKLEIMNDWESTMVNIMFEVNRCFMQLIYDSSTYNSMNGEQAANYFKECAIPNQLMNMYIDNFPIDEFYQKPENGRDRCGCNKLKHPTDLKDLMRKNLDLAAKSFYEDLGQDNLKQQQQLNVFKFVKAYLQTKQSTFDDIIMSIIKREVFDKRKDWLTKGFMANETFKKLAVDTKDTQYRRAKAKDTINKMEDCMKTLKVNLSV